MEEKYDANIFSDGYGETRARADGRAEAFAETFKLIKGLTND